MLKLSSARTVKELKHNYRRLASRYHPDKGGSLTSMQKINNQYQRLLRQFNESANDAFGVVQEGFHHVVPGYQLFVNSTACEVIEVDRDTFLVTAKTKNKIARFDINSGVCVNNPKWQAGFEPRLKPNEN